MGRPRHRRRGFYWTEQLRRYTPRWAMIRRTSVCNAGTVSVTASQTASDRLAMEYERASPAYQSARSSQQGISVFENLTPSFPRKREPRTSLQHETLDSGFRRNDEISAIWENRKTLFQSTPSIDRKSAGSDRWVRLTISASKQGSCVIEGESCLEIAIMEIAGIVLAQPCDDFAPVAQLQ